MSYTQLLRWILAAIDVLVFLPLVLLTVIGWSDSSVNRRPGAALEFAAVLVPMWLLWIAAIAWIIRTRGQSKKPRPPRNDPTNPQ